MPLLLGAATGFHNPSNVAAHIQRILNKAAIVSDISGHILCAGTKPKIVCIGDLTTKGVKTHNVWRYTYGSPKRAVVVHRVETMGGTLLRSQRNVVRPQNYGLRSF